MNDLIERSAVIDAMKDKSRFGGEYQHALVSEIGGRAIDWEGWDFE